MSKALEEELGFRVVFSNIEYSESTHSGARPATDQEKAMWALLLAWQSRIAEMGSKLSTQRAGVDAHSVRNSLGDPPADGGESKKPVRG